MRYLIYAVLDLLGKSMSAAHSSIPCEEPVREVESESFSKQTPSLPSIPTLKDV